MKCPKKFTYNNDLRKTLEFLLSYNKDIDSLQVRALLVEIDRQQATIKRLKEEVEQLRKLRESRELSATERLHRLVDGLEYDKKDSPYSPEAWDELQAENDTLRTRLKRIEAELLKHLEIAQQAKNIITDTDKLIIIEQSINRIKILVAIARGTNERS